MKSLFSTVLLTLSVSIAANAQYEKPTIQASDKLIETVQPLAPAPGEARYIGFRNPPSQDLKWSASLTAVSKNESDDDEMLEKIKAEKDRIKFATQNNATMEGKTTSTVPAPTLGPNFFGINNGGFSTPLDNTIAISNGGVIVVLVNSRIAYYTSTGAVTYGNDIYTLIGDATLTNNMCDPKVIYDVTADRFIFYAQVCDAQSAHSKVVLGFSKTNNPTGGWHFYELTGNPFSDGSWFDYPKLGISTKELFVTGNLFLNSGNFNKSVVYQIQKDSCYAGATSIIWQKYAVPSGGFTLVPLSYGQTGSYGPGIYLASTAGTTSGSTNMNFWDVTNTIASGTAVLNRYTVPTSTYATAGNAAQLGTTRHLNTGDSRGLDGFYLHGFAHFVFNTDAGSGYCGVSYHRINVSTLAESASIYSNVATTDVAYPAVASCSTDSTDNSVIIAFEESGSAIYPRTCAITCDNSMAWSAPLVVKPGITYVQFPGGTGTTDRWGDYTGIARKHNDVPGTVWMAGMYGTAGNIWAQWVAKLQNINHTAVSQVENNEMDMKVYPNPVIDNYAVSFTLPGRENLHITITDMQGRLVKDLYNGVADEGENHFSFDKANLAPGIYSLNIYGTNRLLKNEKIVIEK